MWSMSAPRGEVRSSMRSPRAAPAGACRAGRRGRRGSSPRRPPSAARLSAGDSAGLGPPARPRPRDLDPPGRPAGASAGGASPWPPSRCLGDRRRLSRPAGSACRSTGSVSADRRHTGPRPRPGRRANSAVDARCSRCSSCRPRNLSAAGGRTGPTPGRWRPRAARRRGDGSAGTASAGADRAARRGPSTVRGGRSPAVIGRGASDRGHLAIARVTVGAIRTSSRLAIVGDRRGGRLETPRPGGVSGRRRRPRRPTRAGTSGRRRPATTPAPEGRRTRPAGTSDHRPPTTNRAPEPPRTPWAGTNGRQRPATNPLLGKRRSTRGSLLPGHRRREVTGERRSAPGRGRPLQSSSGGVHPQTPPRCLAGPAIPCPIR